jgi:hypothetical protein
MTPKLISVRSEETNGKKHGKDSRKGSVKGRTQVKNTRTGDWVERDEGKGGKTKGQFKNVKEDRNLLRVLRRSPISDARKPDPSCLIQRKSEMCPARGSRNYLPLRHPNSPPLSKNLHPAINGSMN